MVQNFAPLVLLRYLTQQQSVIHHVCQASTTIWAKRRRLRNSSETRNAWFFSRCRRKSMFSLSLGANPPSHLWYKFISICMTTIDKPAIVGRSQATRPPPPRPAAAAVLRCVDGGGQRRHERRRGGGGGGGEEEALRPVAPARYKEGRGGRRRQSSHWRKGMGFNHRCSSRGVSVVITPTPSLRIPLL